MKLFTPKQLPVDVVKDILSQLNALGLIEIGINFSGAEFRLINITKEGLDLNR